MKTSKRAVVLQRGIVAGIITVFVLMFGVVSPLTAAEFTLKGQTVSLIIGFPPGSGDDVGMRQLVPFLEKNLPGNPTVIVINKPGAVVISQQIPFTLQPREMEKVAVCLQDSPLMFHLKTNQFY